MSLGIVVIVVMLVAAAVGIGRWCACGYDDIGTSAVTADSC